MEGAEVATAADSATRPGWTGRHALRWPRALRRLPVLPGIIIATVIVAALFSNAIAPVPPNQQNLADFLLPPSAAHPMGTDPLGRDVFSRVIHGARISMLVALGSVALAGGIGVLVGLLSALSRGWVGELIMRVADTVLSLPAVLVALSVAATLGPGLLNVIMIIGFLYWAQFARMVRGEALSLRELDYVQAAFAIGCSHWRILWLHIFPNLINTIIVVATLQLASAILLESTLSFLGVGVPPPTSTWGSMVAEGRPYISLSWWIVTFPGLAIMLTVLSVNLLGDWLRDRLDPKLNRRE